ncbi:MAG: sugar phosphate isomerase/epimerase family protein [Muribaculaceae bacterium]
MKRLGIFIKTFSGTLAQRVAQANALGISRIQYNFCVDTPTSLPMSIDDSLVERISATLQHCSTGIDAVSATFNIIHPDHEVRHRGIKAFEAIARCCPRLGCNLITICTGTRDTADMWHGHPDNDSADAWADMLKAMEPLVEIAEECGIDIGIEPETANVVNSADKALRLIDECDSRRLKIVFDPANLFEREPLDEVQYRIEHGLDVLAPHIVGVHAKDRDELGHHVAAGKGVLPYPALMAALARIGYKGPITLHGLSADEATGCAGFVSGLIDKYLK